MKLLPSKILMVLMALAMTTPVSGVASVVTNCKAKAAESARAFIVDTPYLEKVPILELNIDALCKANKNAPGNIKPNADNMSETKVCETSYERAQAAVKSYRDSMERACDKSLGLDLTNTKGQGLFTEEVAKKAQEAAAAKEAAVRKLEKAAKEVKEFGLYAKERRDRYYEDLQKIKMAEEHYQTERKRILADTGTSDKDRKTMLEALDKTRNTTNRIVNTGSTYEYAPADTSGTGVLTAINPNYVAARTGKASTIVGVQGGAGYLNLLPETREGIGLIREQQTAYDTARAFEVKASREIDRLSAEAATLRQYSTGLEPTIKNGTQSIMGGITGNTGNNTGGSSSLPDPKNAMALMGAGSALAGTMNQQAAASAAPANSLWSNYPASTGGLTGLAGGASKQGSSILGGGGSAETVPGKGNIAGEDKDSPASGSPDLSFPAGSYGVASNGDTFVSGNGDLPPEGSSASRTPASEGKPGSGEGGADAKTYGKKKKGRGEREEPANCPAGQDCAALAVAGSSFSKGGSLGVPVIGASDPGLNSAGALDNLFGDLPGLDGPSTPVAGGFNGSGFDLAAELGGMGGESSGPRAQGSTEVAPANSRSLFVRVKIVHERALKKGAVSLFHKKL